MTGHETTGRVTNGSPIGSPPSTRRPIGSGGLHQSPSDGRWIASIYLISGKRVRRKRWNRESAEEALRELLADYAAELGYTYVTGPKPYYFGSGPKRPRSGVTATVRWRVLARDGHRCTYCGATAKDDRLVIDHVIAIANGGTDDEGNLVTACETCNLGKGASPPNPSPR